MLLNVVNKRAGEPQKLIVLLTIIIGATYKKHDKIGACATPAVKAQFEFQRLLLLVQLEKSF